ncbi:MAG: ABC transporter substrate-binding protein [Gaiellaceae bacterium]
MAESSPGSSAGHGVEIATSGLRTFLIADVRGYTRFTHERGDEAAAELAGAFASATRAVVARFDGDVIELRGDEALVVFESTRQALRAAVELQQVAARGSDVAPALPLGLGIGVDAGEAVPLEQGYRGAALNLAARLCAQAQPGEVLASESVVHLAGKVGGLEYRERGRLRLKGLAKPVRAYEVVAEGAPRVKRRRTRGTSSSRARRTRSVASATLVAAALATLVYVLGHSSSASALARIDASSAGAIDPGRNRIVAQVRVGAGPGRLTAGFGSLWVVNDFDSTISRIDPVSGTVSQTIPVGLAPTAIAAGGGFIWVASTGTRSLDRIDPQLGRRVQRIPVGNGPSGVAISPGAVWVTNRLDDTVTEIDLKTGHVRRTLDAGASPSDIVYGLGALWIANESSSTVTRLDLSGGGLRQVAVGNGPEAIAVGDGSVWVANSLDGTVSRIDPVRDVVAATITVGPGPSSVLVSDGAIWVAGSYGGEVARIDPATNSIRQRVSVGSAPQSLAAIDGRVWLSSRETAAVHRGGTLRLAGYFAPDFLDEGIGYSPVAWSVFANTGDGLVGYKRVGGLDGGTLVPDLATSLPVPTDGGRAYTFQLRPGIRYSNGEPVRASDLRRALERTFRLESGGTPYYRGLLGGAACSKSRCDLSRGVVADDGAGTVTVHLLGPDPEFLFKLALPFAYPVPPGVPMAKPAALGVPGTGPYMVRSYRHGRLVLARNPHFEQWSAAAQPAGYPDTIVFADGARDKLLTAVERGKVDLMVAPLPPGRLAEVATRYAAQVRVFPHSGTFGIFLNTRVAPFNNVAVRQAFNYAIDRTKAVVSFGGVEGASATCQILPAGMTSYRPYCPYTRNPTGSGVWTAPDLARARKLVASSGTRGQKVLVWTGPKPFQLATGKLAVATLERLGYRAALKIVPGDNYWSKVQNSRNRAQAGFTGWSADYPAASNFLTIFTCSAFQPRTGNNSNISELCDAQLERAVNRTLARQTTDAPGVSNASWATVDRLVTDLAPWVPLANTRDVVLISRRVGNIQSSPQWGVLFSQIWIR